MSNYDKIADYIVGIYSKIELALLLDIAERFNSYTSISGTLEWYLDKLNDMGKLDSAAIKIIVQKSAKIETEIRKMLADAQFSCVDPVVVDKAYDAGLSALKYDDLVSSILFKDILDKGYKEYNGVIKLIQTKALESHKQLYMDVLNSAYIEVSSGIYSYDESIRRGIKRMTEKGITGVTYKRKDGGIINYSIEAAVRRDTLTSVHGLANETTLESAKVLGTNYVDVTAHLGARVNLNKPIANHAGWQGHQYQLDGSSEDYPNFVETTGYCDIEGFGGVNCRHLMYLFFPGISVPMDTRVDDVKNLKRYKATQVQRAFERDIRKLKKKRACLNAIGANDEMKKIDVSLEKVSAELDKWCKDNDLQRDYTRERVV